ncbi:hypothetical protein BB559_003913 [Furculomyces boomerangus]|uniref:CHY-type domain-containing protein n=1 Tax=Furculomyces boomerangus TaxID=61424 RepID=A0A2T9YHX0_9FUNG|nr:hypothetical protein BB559_003913 [Furculomyces boomerangus]
MLSKENPKGSPNTDEAVTETEKTAEITATSTENSLKIETGKGPIQEPVIRNKKVILCRYIKDGKVCPFGKDCRFSHNLNTLDHPPKKSEFKSNEKLQKNYNPNTTQNMNQNKSNEPKRHPSYLPFNNNDKKPQNVKDSFKSGLNTANYKKKQIRRKQRNAEIQAFLKSTKWVSEIIEDNEDETVIAVKMKPFEKDFPYEIEDIRFAFLVSQNYPEVIDNQSPVEIYISNRELPVGVKTTVQEAFTKKSLDLLFSDETRHKVILSDFIEWLGNNMELLFSMKPASTMKFVAFDKSKIITKPTNNTLARSDDGVPPGRDNIPRSYNKTIMDREPVKKPIYKNLAGMENINRAETNKITRRVELDQLERRFKNSFVVKKSESNKPVIVAFELKLTDPEIKIDVSALNITLSIPEDYPSYKTIAKTTSAETRNLEVPTIHINEHLVVGKKGNPSKWLTSNERKPIFNKIEESFRKHAINFPQNTLLKFVNYVDRYFLEIIGEDQDIIQQNIETSENVNNNYESPKAQASEDFLSGEMEKISVSEDITNVPERQNLYPDSIDSKNQTNLEWPERRGIEIKFGLVNLDQVSLVTCSKLRLRVKCDRCKTIVEFPELLPTMSLNKDKQQWYGCTNCTLLHGVRFRGGWIHPNSLSLGFLDVSNCSPADLRPSAYTLTCTKCVSNVDSEEENSSAEDKNANDTNSKEEVLQSSKKSRDNIVEILPNVLRSTQCRKCHSRLSVLMSDFAFTKLVAGIKLGGVGAKKQITSALKKSEAQSRKKSGRSEDQLKQLGIVLGTPLPQRGTCKHYGKSYRWFRFSCCLKIYPCDICHDEKEDHEAETAKLMICGYCSKEQSTQKADISGKCINCNNTIAKKSNAGSGSFWEGGEGTRDKSRMNRNDSHKYKGLSKTVSNKKVGSAKKD